MHGFCVLVPTCWVFKVVTRSGALKGKREVRLRRAALRAPGRTRVSMATKVGAESRKPPPAHALLGETQAAKCQRVKDGAAKGLAGALCTGLTRKVRLNSQDTSSPGPSPDPGGGRGAQWAPTRSG